MTEATKTQRAAREARLAEALRDNLHRRKQQMRARAAPGIPRDDARDDIRGDAPGDAQEGNAQEGDAWEASAAPFDRRTGNTGATG